MKRLLAIMVLIPQIAYAGWYCNAGKMKTCMKSGRTHEQCLVKTCKHVYLGGK